MTTMVGMSSLILTTQKMTRTPKTMMAQAISSEANSMGRKMMMAMKMTRKTKTRKTTKSGKTVYIMAFTKRRGDSIGKGGRQRGHRLEKGTDNKIIVTIANIGDFEEESTKYEHNENADNVENAKVESLRSTVTLFAPSSAARLPLHRRPRVGPTRLL
eukprot:TRINITY_DN8398_c0_g1_i1.p1 TRINITY_DN8398_c0_g1~~TRINITY_DN8398_c0_g1_i1.p1  ORF type:complete len:158 (+),score=27.92 TRINITY_DN8398_c0_g1_i1:28-501(+)